jgi:Cu+-exporting ATPase
MATGPTPTAAHEADHRREIDLEIEGMTCAACANRIERSVGALPGVDASVNFATERARVQAPDGVEIVDLLAAVSAAGYSATVVAPRHAPTPPPAGGAQDQASDHGSAPTVHDHGSAPSVAGRDALRRRLVISAVLTIPVVLLSMVPPLQFPAWQWVVLALATPVATWGAWPFHRAALRSARHASVGMDTLVSLGVIAAYGWSLYALILGDAGHIGMHMSVSLLGHPEGGAGEIYLEVASAVTVFILLGRWLEARAKREAGAALRSLLELGAKDASLVVGDREELVPVTTLTPGDLVRVRPGGVIPSDGTVVDGAASVDAGMITGESVPVEIGVGDRVVGGTIAAAGTILVRIDAVGADTELARMGRLVEDAQAKKASIQRLADRVSSVFVPIVIALSILALIGWLASGADPEVAFTAAVATLIIACPCALGLATPVALLAGTGRGAQLGILIQGPDVLEQTRRVDTIVLDKTGTVTTGTMAVGSIVTVGMSETDALALAAAVELGSEHPIGSAIVSAARARGARVSEPASFVATAGFGVSAVVDGIEVVAGRLDWVRGSGATVPSELVAAADRAERDGATAIALAAAAGGGRAVVAIISVGDEIKATSAAAVQRLRSLGLHPVLLTGDNAGAAAAVAASVGIDEVVAGVTPEGKLEHVRSLQAAGRVVAMVGDGVNDAAALAAADLGIAMGSGTDAAIAASDLTVVSGDLLVVADAVRLARRTLAIIRGNLFWAFAYNIAALPLAMAGLLNPMLAGAAMAFSSLFVVLNSLRLRGFAPERR